MKLDSTQNEIVTSSAKNIIVSAGAGSGKTRILTERIKYLLSNGVRPDNIVAITFTNKAADEMKSRLYDVPGIGDTFIGTIHSFANKIFKNSGTVYELLTGEKEIALIKELIEKYAKFTTKEIYMNYVDLMQGVELGLIDEKRITEEVPPSVLDELNIFYGKQTDKDYPVTIWDLCKSRNIITFDQLLKECSKYFESIEGKLEYLLVDELQDIGYNEYKFLKSLNADNNFYVGDDWQSIYGFKGGDVKIFLNLMQNPKWATYYLTNNYRNAKSILDIAKTIIHQADNIIDKEVIPVRDEQGIVEIATKKRLPEYLEQIQESGDYKDWFILVRTNKDVVEISSLLTLMNIPCITFKQSDGMENVDIKMALDSVKILTVHAAKGLENKNVILYGNFPVHQPKYLKQSDERKVAYVGCTRAMDKLIILN